ncbi:NADP-dependent oxidoreductase [Mycobacteroides abscessus]|uniref:NADP-dependent oxidoreductase n=2 Tax=Mycobacteroides abscessus TaxID=36809 RepID=UPI0009A59702|nr:NADP-dependent oxidoreductase [Mycobacteroides abscessus]
MYPAVTAGNEYRPRPLLLPEPFDESGSSVDLDKEQRTMRAVGFSEFGGPEVMKVLSLPEPIPGPGEVRIRVTAADINPSDALARSGRLVETGPKRFPLSQSYVVGWNVAGVIDSVGSINGSNLRVGDSVIALVLPRLTAGAQAEYVVAPVDQVVLAPQNMSLVEASTLLLNAYSAWLALDRLSLSKGDSVLVTGGAGAVGSYVIELAKSYGLVVIADAAPKDRDLVADSGADVVLPRGDGLLQAVLDQVGQVGGTVDTALVGASLSTAVRDGGTIFTLQPPPEPETARVKYEFEDIYFHVPNSGRILQRLRDLAEQGVLTPRVADVYLPQQIVEAHERLSQGNLRGRLVLAF